MVSFKKPKLVTDQVKTAPDQKVELSNELLKLWEGYISNTEPKLKLIDAYLSVVLLIGVTLFLYCVIFMQNPFHIFLSAFISCVGSFVLGVALRMQLDPDSNKSFPSITQEKAIFDFVLAHILLHLVVVNYIG